MNQPAQTAPDTPVLEIVSFRLNAETDPAEFEAAARGIETILRERGTARQRMLTVDSDGLWTDVVEWRSMDEALLAAQEVVKHPLFAPIGPMIDGDTVNMRHVRVLQKME